MLIRPRRNRKSSTVRSIAQENELHIKDLIAPLFVVDTPDGREPIGKMPGIERYSIKELIKQAESLASRGIQTIALFPSISPSLKDPKGIEATNRNGLIPRTVRALKNELSHLCIITDIALDPFTSHGHDGVVSDQNEILNDETIELLAMQAIVHAEAGVDIVAPSDMMDGRIGKIRQALDNQGFQNTSILAYTAKYASSLYNPFRDALKVSLSFGDKLTYQLNPANTREALLEATLDQEEGADMLMVKPATFYLDILSKIRDLTHIPVGAYHVSGEYAMVVAAHQLGYLEKHKVFHEALLSIKRAGASFIFTYAYNEMLDLYGH